ncbi:hypothetical protein [Zavarzinia aquatilis]|uniref:Uncharacterized protein n=1 Tax=Zavarzinia aquatilis TaxID=2211142 RepID=A0A317EJC4_9PROT|nr:hypothetical protein [Zavarzinia aquatilis]PWR25513.1 hypothetical protein DKG74_00620 [Zavarzinia aquatilis]
MTATLSRHPPAATLAGLSDALAALCLEAGTAESALEAAIAEVLVHRPKARPGLVRRLWGTLPAGDDDRGDDGARARLRREIEAADGRRIAIAWIAAQAETLPPGPGGDSVRAHLLRAAVEAGAAEQRRAEAGRQALHDLMPLRREGIGA